MTISDGSGIANVVMLFKGKWNLGSVELGHMVALEGVSYKSDGGQTEMVRVC